MIDPMKYETVDAYFYDHETGFDFFVELDTAHYTSREALYDAAVAIAREYFESPIFGGWRTVEEAEALGYDTY